MRSTRRAGSPGADGRHGYRPGARARDENATSRQHPGYRRPAPTQGHPGYRRPAPTQGHPGSRQVSPLRLTGYPGLDFVFGRQGWFAGAEAAKHAGILEADGVGGGLDGGAVADQVLSPFQP